MGLGARCPGPPARGWAGDPLLSWACPRRRDQTSAVGSGGCWGAPWGFGGLGRVLSSSGAATPPRYGLSSRSLDAAEGPREGHRGREAAAHACPLHLHSWPFQNLARRPPLPRILRPQGLPQGPGGHGQDTLGLGEGRLDVLPTGVRVWACMWFSAEGLAGAGPRESEGNSIADTRNGMYGGPEARGASRVQRTRRRPRSLEHQAGLARGQGCGQQGPAGWGRQLCLLQRRR